MSALIDEIVAQIIDTGFRDALKSIIRYLGTDRKAKRFTDSLANFNQVQKAADKGERSEENIAILKAQLKGIIRDQLERLSPAQLLDIMELIKDLPPDPGKHKLFYFAANPSDQDAIRTGLDLREIKAALENAKKKDKLVIADTAFSARRTDLVNGLRKHHPTIVHFAGHGNESGLALEDEEGYSSKLSNESLKVLFGEYRSVKCVFLNACHTQSQAQLISTENIYVLGTPTSIDDSMAAKFASAFYTSIAEGKELESAYRLALVVLEEYPEVEVPRMLYQGKEIN